MKRLFFVFVLMALFALPLAAQPFSSFVLNNAGTNGYVDIPHSSAFNFSNGFTFEAWVAVKDDYNGGTGCSSIFGKDYTTAQWVGVCGGTLRSYLRGSGTSYDAGTIPANDWTHIAVTWDGTTHKHYIDGELVGSRTESGSMTNNTANVRIGSDVSWPHSPTGAIDEVRLWNVALTQDQIRANINKTIDAPQTGLVAVYHLDGAGSDSIAGHNGTTVAPAAFYYVAYPVSCTAGSKTLCIGSTNRFEVRVTWLTVDGTRGDGSVVPGFSADSGLFWFFNSNNWELLVKSLDACGLNNRKWLFSAATTNVHYEIEVHDTKTGVIKRYFNYQGNAAPANTDTDAFATCP